MKSFGITLFCIGLSLASDLHAKPQQNIQWHDAKFFLIEGKGWADTVSSYDRLPARAEKKVIPTIWMLSKYTSGISVRFNTNSTNIHVRWKLTSPTIALPRMPASSVSGLDLYIKNSQQWQWLSNAPALVFPNNESHIISQLDKTMHEFRLYLPMYNGVEMLQIGVDQNATINTSVNESTDSDPPILFYGSSIVSGEFVSRPGLAYPSILGRRLNRQVINLGFSGFCRMEKNLTDILSEVNVSALVIDCLPNMHSGEIQTRTTQFVRLFREKHPATPVILVEYPYNPQAQYNKATRDKIELFNANLKLAYEELCKEGIQNLNYLAAENLSKIDHDTTADGLHLNDLGATRFADRIEPILKILLDRSVKN